MPNFNSRYKASNYKSNNNVKKVMNKSKKDAIRSTNTDVEIPTIQHMNYKLLEIMFRGLIKQQINIQKSNNNFDSTYKHDIVNTKLFESIQKFENKVDKISEDNGTLIKMVGELKDSKLKLAKIEHNFNKLKIDFKNLKKCMLLVKENSTHKTHPHEFHKPDTMVNMRLGAIESEVTRITSLLRRSDQSFHTKLSSLINSRHKALSRNDYEIAMTAHDLTNNTFKVFNSSPQATNNTDVRHSFDSNRYKDVSDFLSPNIPVPPAISNLTSPDCDSAKANPPNVYNKIALTPELLKTVTLRPPGERLKKIKNPACLNTPNSVVDNDPSALFLPPPPPPSIPPPSLPSPCMNNETCKSPTVYEKMTITPDLLKTVILTPSSERPRKIKMPSVSKPVDQNAADSSTSIRPPPKVAPVPCSDDKSIESPKIYQRTSVTPDLLKTVVLQAPSDKPRRTKNSACSITPKPVDHDTQFTQSTPPLPPPPPPPPPTSPLVLTVRSSNDKPIKSPKVYERMLITPKLLRTVVLRPSGERRRKRKKSLGMSAKRQKNTRDSINSTNSETRCQKVCEGVARFFSFLR